MYVYSSPTKKEEETLKGSSARLRECFYNEFFEVFLKEVL
jgi:hypothetical protein